MDVDARSSLKHVFSWTHHRCERHVHVYMDMLTCMCTPGRQIGVDATLQLVTLDLQVEVQGNWPGSLASSKLCAWKTIVCLSQYSRSKQAWFATSHCLFCTRRLRVLGTLLVFNKISAGTRQDPENTL